MVQQYFDESHNILRQTIRKFLEREVLPYVETDRKFVRDENRIAGSVIVCQTFPMNS